MSDESISLLIIILTIIFVLTSLIFRKRVVAAIASRTAGTENIAKHYFVHRQNDTTPCDSAKDIGCDGDGDGD